MSKNNLKKGIVLMISLIMVFGTVTVFASGRVDGTYTISGNTKVLGSAFIEESGFGKHQANWSASIVGSDKDATKVRYIFYYGDSIAEEGFIGGGYGYYAKYNKTWWFSSARTTLGTNSYPTKYINITAK